MKIFKRIFSPVATIVGGLLGGPAGAMLGGAVGGAFQRGNMLTNMAMGGALGGLGYWGGSKLTSFLGIKAGGAGVQGLINTTVSKAMPALYGAALASHWYEANNRRISLKENKTSLSDLLGSDNRSKLELDTRSGENRIKEFKIAGAQEFEKAYSVEDTGLKAVEQALAKDREEEQKRALKIVAAGGTYQKIKEDPNEEEAVNPVAIDAFTENQISRRKNRTRKKYVNRPDFNERLRALEPYNHLIPTLGGSIVN